MQKIKQLFAWLRKNEQHISTVVFVAGTTTDILTLSKVSISYAISLLGIYILVAVAATITEHYLYIHEDVEGPFLKGLRVTLAFLAEFMIGCLLSGFLVFYTRSAALNVSWPFVLLLVMILFGNEFLRNYKERLAFRVTLIFFAIYAYTIFTLPTILHQMNSGTFLKSSAISVLVTSLFIIGLSFAGWKRLKESLLEVLGGVIGVLLIVNISYFTGIIPPLPLALREVGVYHTLTYQAKASGVGTYVTQGESGSVHWWDALQITPETIHVVPGDSLSVFSSVFAPVSFSTAIIHKWEWYDQTTHSWKRQAEVAFGISGGRDGGYRGYSTVSVLKAGKYRVSIETLDGQVIGRTYFTIQTVQVEPALQTEMH